MTEHDATLRQLIPNRGAAETRGPATGERALMRAVLVDAIESLAGEGAGTVGARARLALEARRWVTATDSRWPYSFENVCHGLDLDPDRVRRRVLRMAAETRAEEASRPGPPSGRSLTEERIARLICSGQPLRAVAKALGLSESRVKALSGGLATRLKLARNEHIRALRQAGWTPAALAARFGLSRGSIRGICQPENGHSGATVREARRSAAGDPEPRPVERRDQLGKRGRRVQHVPERVPHGRG